MEPPKPLLTKLKEALVNVMKSGNTDAKDVLRVLLSRVQLIQIKSENVSDEQIINLAKTVIAQNDEDISGRLKVEGGSEIYAEAILRLTNQNNYLKGFLPQFLTEEQIVATLSTEDNIKQINSAKSDGAATGIALKILKSLPEFAGMAMDGGLVKDIVKGIYKKEVV